MLSRFKLLHIPMSELLMEVLIPPNVSAAVKTNKSTFMCIYETHNEKIHQFN